MTKRLFFGALLALFLVPSLKAQVATPSLDPSEPVWSGPAVGWRQTMALQLSASNHDGSTYGDSGTLTHENHRKSSEFLVTLFWKDLRLEGSGGEETEKRHDVSADSFAENTHFVKKESLAYVIEKTISLGLWSDSLGYPVQQSGTGAGLSLRLGNLFYLGYGREARWQEDYKWEENFLGLAIYKPKSFRAEYSELRKDDAADGSGNRRDGYKRNRVSLEFYTSELLWTLFTQSDTSNQNAVVGDKLEAFGFSWMPAEKFSIGARYERTQADENDLETGWRLSAGLLF